MCGRKYLNTTTFGDHREPTPQRLQDKVMHAVLHLIDEQRRPVMRGDRDTELKTALESLAHSTYRKKQGSSILQTNKQLGNVPAGSKKFYARQVVVNVSQQLHQQAIFPALLQCRDIFYLIFSD